MYTCVNIHYHQHQCAQTLTLEINWSKIYTSHRTSTKHSLTFRIKCYFLWPATTTLLQTFYDPLSKTTLVSRYQKDKPFWILLKQTWWGGSGISWTICNLCKLFALRSRRQPRQHLITQIFTGRMPFLTPNKQHQSTEGPRPASFPISHQAFLWPCVQHMTVL